VLTNTTGGFLGAFLGFVLLHLIRAMQTNGASSIQPDADGSPAS
jgi:hypothetical protein